MINNNRLPIVVIVGRPNVGKSSLFNRLLNKKVAITHEQSGVTRDRHYMDAEWNGRDFQLVDTGGLQPRSNDPIDRHIREQVETAVSESQLIIFLVDGQDGRTDLDMAIARDLKPHRDRVLLVANKSDNRSVEEALYDFAPLGYGPAFPVSALHGRGTGDLLDIVVSRLPEADPEAIPEKHEIRIAILGRPNVGKSTLVNRLLGEARMITNDQPGTTRDAVDSFLSFQGQNYCLIDTAGLRKRSHVHETIEYVSNLHTERGLDRCDVAVVLVDAQEGLEEQDVRIMQMVMEKGRGLILGLNKWDTVAKEGKTFDKRLKDMKIDVHFLDHYPVISLSAKTGQRAVKVLEMVRAVYERMNRNVAPQALAAFLADVSGRHAHPAVKGKRVLIYSMASSDERPFTFDVRSNLPDQVKEPYMRYLLNRFYEHFDAQGVPVLFNFIKRKARREKRSPS
ncbi:MAG: ribosome biogenesis GTPase Der [Fibrobacterota bacterium]